MYIYGARFLERRKRKHDGRADLTLHAGDVYSSDYTIKLAGEHQIANASVAIVAAKLVSKQDDRINELALHIALPIPSGPEGWSALAKSRMLF